MRFAVIGAGVIGELHAEVISALPDAELRAVIDTHPERAGALAERHHADALTDPQDAFSRSDLDAVAICTPSGTHANVAVAALEAGKHVVVEKPIDTTLEAAERIAKAQAHADRQVTVISQHRFDPASQIVHSAVRSGRFGRVTSATAIVAWWRSQRYYDSAGWRGTWALDGGGVLINQGIHTIDLLVWFLGIPLEAFAWTGCFAHDGIEVEDTAAATIRFASGALATVHGTTAAYPGLTARLQLHGDRGSAIIDNDRLSYFHAATGSEPGPDVGAGCLDNQAHVQIPASPEPGNVVSGLSIDAHTAQYRDLLDAIAAGRAPLVTVAEATRTLAVIRALYTSAEAGKPALVTT